MRAFRPLHHSEVNMDTTSAPVSTPTGESDPLKVDAQTALEKALEAQLSSHITAGLGTALGLIEVFCISALLFFELEEEKVDIVFLLSVILGLLIVFAAWTYSSERRAFASWRFAYAAALARGEFEPTKPEPQQLARVLEDEPSLWTPPEQPTATSKPNRSADTGYR